jgi:hypothetical protein
MKVYQKLIFIHLLKFHHHHHHKIRIIKILNMLENQYLIQLWYILILIVHQILHNIRLMMILILNFHQVSHRLFTEIMNEILFKKINY